MDIGVGLINSDSHHEKLHTDSVQSDEASSEEDKVVCLAKVLASQGKTNSDLQSTNNRIMLATAIVCIHDANGMPQQCIELLLTLVLK